MSLGKTSTPGQFGTRTIVLSIVCVLALAAAGLVWMPVRGRDRGAALALPMALAGVAAIAGATAVRLAARARGHGRVARAALLASAVVPMFLATIPSVVNPPRPLDRQPFPDAAEYADAARQLVQGAGYVTVVHDGRAQPPRYPPGFSITLAPFVATLGYPNGAHIGSKVMTISYVIVASLVAWAVGGPLAAGVMAVMVAASPFAPRAAALVMSDATFAMLALAIAVVLARPSSSRLALLVGVLAGLATTVRLAGVLSLAAAMLSLSGRQRWIAFMGALPPVLALLGYQWLTFGSPFMTGYDYWLPGTRNLDVANLLNSPIQLRDGTLFGDALEGRLFQWICPCPHDSPQGAMPHIVFYPVVVGGLFWVFSPPFVTVAGGVLAIARRDARVARYVLWSVVLYLGFYMLYFYQATRFMAAPATLLAALAAVWLGQMVESWVGGVGDEPRRDFAR